MRGGLSRPRLAPEPNKGLAATFAFRRASGELVDRATFLESAAQSGPRTQTITSITLLGRDRALVTCVVSMPVKGAAGSFDHVRLFVREKDEWKLLAWANERL